MYFFTSVTKFWAFLYTQHAACTLLKRLQNHRFCLVSLCAVQKDRTVGRLQAFLITWLSSWYQSAPCQSSNSRLCITKCLRSTRKLALMNSAHKQITCVCDTVRPVRLGTSQLLAVRFCLCLQTAGKCQSSAVGHLDSRFVLSRSTYKDYRCPKDPPLSGLTAAFYLKKETDITPKFVFLYRHRVSKISVRNVKFLSVLLLFNVECCESELVLHIECDVRMTERNNNIEYTPSTHLYVFGFY